MHKRNGIPNPVFASITVILLVLAAVGYSLYLTKPSVVSTTTSTSTVTGGAIWETAGFYNGTIVTFIYPKEFYLRSGPVGVLP